MMSSKIISRSLLQLGAIFLFTTSAGSLALPTSTDSTARTTSRLLGAASAARFNYIHLSASKTISKSTTTAPTWLYLNVTTLAPDSLGFADVSSVYGPGAWAGWFLTGVASWLQIFKKSEKKRDLNTWAFLFGINWSAVDVFKAIHRVRSNPPAENETGFEMHMAAFGAAFTVLFWGVFHALFQFLATLVVFENSKCKSRRLATLVVGLVLPFTALMASAYLSRPLQNGEAAFQLLPALYRRGMDRTEHAIYVAIACFTPIIFAPPAVTWAKYRDSDALSARFNPFDIPESPSRTWVCLGMIYCVLSSGLLFVFLFLGLGIRSEVLYWVVIPFLFMLSFYVPAMLPIVWYVSVLFGTWVYIWTGYFRLQPDAWISESCFFMPCSPQSIKDDDQMFGLLVGVFLFVGLDALLMVFGYLKRWYRENRHFIQVVEGGLRQFEMRRRVAAGPEAVSA
jgi:hypothetical protein